MFETVLPETVFGPFFLSWFKGANACRSVLWNLVFKLEISDGQNLVKFVGTTFLPLRKALEISGRISANISEIPFQILRFFGTSFSRRAVLRFLEGSALFASICRCSQHIAVQLLSGPSLAFLIGTNWAKFVKNAKWMRIFKCHWLGQVVIFMPTWPN